MSKTRRAQSALPYVQRLLEDESVQEQLRNAAGGIRAVYLRARKQRGEAAEDKRLYRNLRQAATSIRNAASALQKAKPPPKRRFRKAAIVTLALSGCVWSAMKLQQLESRTEDDQPG